MGKRRLASILVGLACGAGAWQCASFGVASGDGDGDGDGGGDGGGGNGGACVPAAELPDGGEDASCGDLLESPASCGFCGHACAECASGKCTPSKLAPIPNPASALAVVSDDDVLFANGLGIVAELAGGQAKPLASMDAGVGALVVDEQGIYVETQVGIYSLPRGGGTAVEIAPGRNNQHALTEDATNVYWYDDGNEVLGASKATGQPLAQPLVSLGGGGPVSIIAIAADDDAVFWVESSASGAVVKRRTADGSVHPVVTTPRVESFAIDAKDVYWGAELTIMRAPRDGSGHGEVVATWTSEKTHTIALALDDASVYWFAGDDSNGAANTDQTPVLYVAPKCGGPVRALTTDTQRGAGPGLGASRIYWVSFGGLFSIPK